MSGSAGPHAPQATEISQAVHIIFIITEVGLVVNIECLSGRWHKNRISSKSHTDKIPTELL